MHRDAVDAYMLVFTGKMGLFSLLLRPELQNLKPSSQLLSSWSAWSPASHLRLAGDHR